VPNSVTLCYSSPTLDFKNNRAGLYIINIITAFCLLVIVEQTNPKGEKFQAFVFFCSQSHSCNVKSIHHRGTYTMNRHCTCCIYSLVTCCIKQTFYPPQIAFCFCQRGNIFLLAIFFRQHLCPASSVPNQNICLVYIDKYSMYYVIIERCVCLCTVTYMLKASC
jgi:hypothetical protein